jgi:hypothetical protein
MSKLEENRGIPPKKMNSKPLCSYRPEESFLSNPYRVKPLALWLVLRWLGQEQSAQLKERQRTAYKEPEPVQDHNNPLFGTPAHCMIGAQPPWPVFSVRRITIYHVPIVFQLISARRINEETRAAGELFDLSLYKLYKERGLSVPWITPEIHKFGTPRNVFDALAVWVNFVEDDLPPESEQEFLTRLYLSPQKIISQVIVGHHRAAEIADDVVSAIEINFKEEVRT